MNEGFVVWDNAFSVGEEEIDKQHQQIIEMLNDLYEARNFNRESEVVGDVVERMCHYVRDHFNTEETLMAEVGYPGLSAHHSEHEFFIAEAGRLCPRKGDADLDVNRLMEFLKDWLLEHIAKTDHLYVPYLKKRSN